MKACYLDANVLIAFKNEESPFHSRSISLLENLLKKGYLLVVSPLVLDEFLYVVAYLLKIKKEKNLYKKLNKNLKDILQLVKVVNPPTSRKGQLKVVELMEKYNLHPRDAFHLLVILFAKIEACATFDKDFVEVEKKKLVRIFN